MQHVQVEMLLENIDLIYNGPDVGDEALDESTPMGVEARAVLEGVINILRENPDLADVLNLNHPALITA